MTGLLAIVLAAGMGKRMKSRVPKVLHPIAGRPLVHYPIAAAFDAGAAHVVVVVSPASRDEIDAELRSAFPGRSISTAVQEVARGTGDAARIGLEASARTTGHALILCGDTPLLLATDLLRLREALRESSKTVAVLSADLDEPAGYGRILRDVAGHTLGIREDRDLEPDDRARLKEVNAGVYCARVETLSAGLLTLTTDNAQGEYYLTDLVAFAASQGGALAVKGNPEALVGVNDRSQLARAEQAIFERIAERHRLAGVAVRRGAYIDDSVILGEDARVEAGVHLRGKTTIGPGAVIDAGSVVTDSAIGEGANIKPYSVVVDSEVGARAQIGPFAHLRPASVIEEDAHIGNFVETKKTRVRKGAKANHLAYLGDGDIGPGANVGAGTIFCNYDGFSKHPTIVGAGAFIGSDSQLVAPVTIGKGAYVATGTTVTKDVPDDALAIGRIKQENKLGYAARLRGRLQATKKKSGSGA